MAWGALYPPNCNHLSDQVIGSVTETASRRSHVFDVNEDRSRADDQDSNEHIYPNSECFSRPSTHVRTTSRRETTCDQPRKKVGRCSENMFGPGLSETKAEQILAIHRERRRLIQQRYRQKIRNRANTVEVVVERLQNEVSLLKKTYDRLTEDIPTKNTPWSVIAEYFRLFSNGLKSVPTTVGRQCFETNKHQQFLSNTMAPDVLVKSGRGVDAILEIWKAISRRQDGLETSLVRLEHGEQDLLLASTKCTFTLTHSLLLHEFPHIFDEEGELLPVAAKLLDKKIVLPSSVRFVWDEATGSMTSVIGKPFKNEMVAPLLKVLGNLEDVAWVLGISDVPAEQ
ncbi:unnamed protein product [Phytophthora lilii]|uniref:Unnamed protein product n=1 Tax=Phytophthora lilii TaxID=2077276 RepID=A0A9W6XLH2_9STRA|nr:unnamed protein product [Phytophthora lilii]